MLTTHGESSSSSLDWLASGGEVGKQIRALDWSQTPLGPIEYWSPSLKTTLSLCLLTPFPMAIYWGPDLRLFYNDAWAPIIRGKKEPLGKAAATEVWPEIWSIVGPQFDRVLQGAEAVSEKDHPFAMSRWNEIHERDELEECYFHYSFSPIREPDGRVGGVLNVTVENTYRVLTERRFKLMQNLNLYTSSAKSEKEACELAAHHLRDCPLDIPFALLYLVDQERSVIRLMASCGIDKDPLPLTIPQAFDLHQADTMLASVIACVVEGETPQIIDDLSENFGFVLNGAWPEPVEKAFVVGVVTDQSHSMMVLIGGISPRLPFNEAYRQYFTEIASQITRSIANARDHERERQLTERLKALDLAKSTFFSNASHELRTPVTLMVNPLGDALSDQEYPLASRQQERIAMARRNALRLLSLVNSLLDFSKLEAKRLRASYVPTDLSQALEDLVNTFEPGIERAGLGLSRAIEPLTEKVFVDQSMFEKIIFNLLSNALKFTQEGSIRVSLAQEGQAVKIQVQDTGVGIPSDQLPRMFERFYRIDQSYSRSHEGTGIGLALSKELVQLHGGSLSVASEVGQGSTFTLLIPLGKAHLAEEQIYAQIPASDPSSRLGSAFVEESLRWSVSPTMPTGTVETLDNRKIILLADDNADMRSYIHTLLSRHWHVVAVGDGEEALKRAFALHPHLILSDIMMPKMDGLALTQALRRDPSTALIPIILLSARAGEDSRVSGLSQGVDDYIVKPFVPRELIARIQTHLDLGLSRMQLDAKVKEHTLALEQTIEQLQNTEAALRKREADYRTIAATSPAGIIRTDLEGRILFINPSACAMLDIAPSEASTLCWTQFLDPEGAPRVLEGWQAMMRGHAPYFRAEHYFSHKGKTACVVLESIPERDLNNHVIGCLVVFMDVSPLKKLEQERFEAVQAMEEQQRKRAIDAEEYRRLQARFIDTLCHELRNPMQGVVGHLELLSDSLKEIMAILPYMLAESDSLQALARIQEACAKAVHECQESIRKMQSCTTHQTSITSDILTLSRLASGKVALHLKPFSVQHMVQDVSDMLEAQWIQKKIQFHLKMRHDLGWVQSDPDRLKAVLLNLLQNAIKFTPPGGHISLDLSQENAEEGGHAILHFRVEDTGVGISKADQQKLGGRFEQANIITHQDYGGSGLGLMISKQFIELMGGSIRIHSEGRGTTVQFDIRCERVCESAPAPLLFSVPAALSCGAVPPFEAKHVLIVDDMLLNQSLFKKQLAQHRCETANNGLLAVEAWAQAQRDKTPFDIILMDIEMPQMNGLEATKTIRQREEALGFPHTPIIGISGNSSELQVAEGLSSGMDHYFVKPIKKEVLLAIIEDPLQGAAVKRRASALF